MSFDIILEAPELEEFLEEQPERAEHLLREFDLKAGQFVVGEMRQQIHARAKYPRTGQLAAMVVAEELAPGVVQVGSQAPYAYWADQGRGPVEARPGHYLRFSPAPGVVLYRKRVGPAEGIHYVQGTASAVPEGLAELMEGILETWLEP